MRYAFVLMMLALSACSLGLEPVSTDVEVIELGDRLGDSFFQGYFGDMQDIEGYAHDVTVDVDNSEYFSAHSYVAHDKGEALTILSTYGGTFNSSDFVVGESITFDYLRGSEQTDMLVFVVGCLFNEVSNGPYDDDHADEVEIFTELVDDNVKRVNYIARWFDTEGMITDELQGFINIEVR
jgi:hypothetical protein